MARKTKPVAKNPGVEIPGGHTLLKSAYTFAKQNKSELTNVVVVAGAVNIAIQIFLTAEMSTIYQGVWFILISCALIWFIRSSANKNSKLELSNAFYNGTAPALKFFLTLCVVGLSILPFLLGVFVFATVNNIAHGVIVLSVLAGIIWAMLSIVTMWLFVRWVFALIIVTLPNYRPIESLKLSAKLTRGIIGKLLARMLVLLFYSCIFITVTSVVFSLIPVLSSISQLVTEGVSTVVLVPLFYLYTFEIYKKLQ